MNVGTRTFSAEEKKGRDNDHLASPNQGKDELLSDASFYQRLIDKLLYLIITRPDIAFSVQTLSQFLHQPKKSHLEATLRVVKYVKNQTGHGVLLSSKADNGITAYCDADWSACPYSRKSVTGFLVKFGDSLISWKSKKQRTISRSSTELEYRSLASTTVELTWILGLFKEVGIEVQLPIEVHIDSKLAMQIAANPERGR
ncbi:secreted RxLR effector protein 161-like [Nicotiana sylvestris]|uniref:secreted RxLR effector protein 161-like n=1 Tax=Nicotiana sylvestris TaxID=4096 RepID=UPI00388C72CC